MKKKYAVLAAAVLTGILITGCGQKAAASGWEANENSIYVSKGLEVESALIYTSEKTNDLYTQDEMCIRDSRRGSALPGLLCDYRNLRRIWAVSYTHLDVYKRQRLSHPGRNLSGEEY